MASAGPARRRSIWRMSRPAGWTRFWEFNLNPWDTAAGALLVLEAGGAMLRFDRSPFRLDSQEVMATNGLLTDEILGFFEDMFAGRGIEPVPTPAEFAARRLARS